MAKVAIILAGGLGKRLRSVVNDRPKPMALIQGKPFLAYQMDYWIGQGISRFILSVGYKYEMVIDHFGYEYNGAQIDYAIETKPLGTGGGFMLAFEKLQKDTPFLLLNGDTYFTVDLRSLIDFADSNDSDFTFSLFRTQDQERYMGVELAKDGSVMCLKYKSSGVESHLASGGVYWVRNQAMFSSFSNLKMSPISFEDQILPSIQAAKRRIFGKQFDTTFIDIGVPVDYLRAGLVLTGRGAVTKVADLENVES